MSTQDITSTNNVQGLSTSAKNQYALWQIVGIWLAGGGPMWLLGWIVYPATSIGLSPVDAGLLRIKLLTVGLIWQFALAMIILYFQEGNIRLTPISGRFWLNHPVSARTGERKKSLWSRGAVCKNNRNIGFQPIQQDSLWAPTLLVHAR